MFDPAAGTYGPNTYTLKAGYRTPDELAARKAANAPGPNPEPDPEPGGLTGQAIADFLGHPTTRTWWS